MKAGDLSTWQRLMLSWYIDDETGDAAVDSKNTWCPWGPRIIRMSPGCDNGMDDYDLDVDVDAGGGGWQGWLWIFPRRRSIPSNEGSRPFRPIYQSPPKWPPSPHPHPIPNSPIVLVQLRPLVDVDALLTLLLLSPLSLSLSLWSISPLFLIKAMGFWLYNRICLSVKILSENWNTMT